MSEAIIDTNVNISRWPTRRIREDEPAQLVTKLRSHGVVETWAGSLDGLLHKDIGAVNARLTEICDSIKDIRMRPFGSINPMLPDWEEDLRRCAIVHKMRGIRLHPNYHGYKLDSDVFKKLLQQATDYRMVVSLAVQMEDERMMHPLMRVRPVDMTPLAEIVPAVKGLKLLVHNAPKSMLGSARQWMNLGEVYLDTAMLEGMNALEDILKDIPLERLVFGSHAPLYYFEANKLKLKESLLHSARLQAIQLGNAQRLLG
ncbi:MAG: amidohydrolase family protein [Pirellula sp.]